MPLCAFEELACPLDGQPLQRVEQRWCCDSGHSFDIARQGYVHLLPVQNKRSRDPGDSKDMVAARRRFLAAGHYQPIADAVNRGLLQGAADRDRLSCMDAGCGEGYYLRQLAAAAPEKLELALLGLDISKWAILSAAKQEKRARWVVGTNAHLPVLAESLDGILCLFGFPVYGEFSRVLKKGGLLLQADPGPDHLRELREIIYPELKAPREQPDTAPEGFRYLEPEGVRYNLTLTSQEQIGDLLAMTPHLYRAPAEGRERAFQLQSLQVTVDVVIRRLEKL